MEKLSPAEESAYMKKYAYVQVMFANGGDDYIAARCLLINNLIESAAILYCQSVEKAIKGYIYLATGEMTKLKSNEEKHSPYFLKEELRKHCDYGFDKYDDFLKHIAGHWHWRYHDTPNNMSKRSKTISGNELESWDEFWLFLFTTLPLPDQIKYRLSFPAMSLSRFAVRINPQTKFWLLKDNKAFGHFYIEMQRKYEELNLG